MKHQVYIYLLIIIGCNNHDHFTNTLEKVDYKVLKDIPIETDGYLKGKQDFLYPFIKSDAFQLGLDSLELGYDSLQVRIWLGHSMALKRDVVILKYSKEQWQAIHIKFELGDKDELKHKIVRKVVPSSGWNRFLNRVLELKMLELPDEKEIEGYDGCGADGNPFYFEWASTKKYRFYSYCNPDGNVEKFWQARNVLSIADFLEKEFGFDYTR
ncbi:MAG TPA: hypothetical protein PLS50_08765 [Candidatus Dojkabacteria bacterium]|nr:hypothetical protein [Candidatus Dojkabacteria bacterium]